MNTTGSGIRTSLQAAGRSETGKHLRRCAPPSSIGGGMVTVKRTRVRVNLPPDDPAFRLAVLILQDMAEEGGEAGDTLTK